MYLAVTEEGQPRLSPAPPGPRSRSGSGLGSWGPQPSELPARPRICRKKEKSGLRLTQLMVGVNPPPPPTDKNVTRSGPCVSKSFHREGIGATGGKRAFITVTNYTAKSRHLHRSKGSADFCLRWAATSSGWSRGKAACVRGWGLWGLCLCEAARAIGARPLSPCVPPRLTRQEILYKPIKRARIGTDLGERGGSSFPGNETKKMLTGGTMGQLYPAVIPSSEFTSAWGREKTKENNS